MEVNRFAWWLLGCILHACMTCAFSVLRQTKVIAQNQQQRYQWFNGWGKLTCLKRSWGDTPRTRQAAGSLRGPDEELGSGSDRAIKEGHASAGAQDLISPTVLLHWVPRPSPRALPTAQPAREGESRTTAGPRQHNCGFLAVSPTPNRISVSIASHTEPLPRALSPPLRPHWSGPGGGPRRLPAGGQRRPRPGG